MSRISLIALGPLPGAEGIVTVGPGLRSDHLATALARAGHDLQIVSTVTGTDSAGGRQWRRTIAGRSVDCIDAPEAAFPPRNGTGLVDAVRCFGPEAIIGVTVYGATLASRLGLDVPLWADVFGDPMAEAQSKANAFGSDASVPRFWSMLRPVLDRADRFSAVSRAQADALIGQLGLAGRLGVSTAGERLVEVIPCAAEAEPAEATSARQRKGRASFLREQEMRDDAFVVLWSGSFNTWCDVETLARGLELAMMEEPSIHFLATGGPVSGHDDRTWACFRALVGASPKRDRYRLLGWVDEALVRRCYLAADVGLHIERDLYERRLGAENRVVQWLAHGIPCVTTALSEFGRRLVDEELCVPVQPRDPRGLADSLIELARDRARCARLARECREFAWRYLGFDQTASPLVAWAARPVHASDHRRPRPLTIGLVSEPAAMIDLLEAYLSDLHLREVTFRGIRWLARRISRRARGALGVNRAGCDGG